MSGWKKMALVGAIGLLFFGSRLVEITKLPVFADEAIYIRWAQLMNQDFPRYAFFPMQDGKPPLYMWMLRAWLPLFPDDPLLAARLMNMTFGAASMILIAWFTYLISSSKRAAVAAGGLYTILPFTFFFDRMGLIDPFITLFTAMVLVGLGLWLKHKKLGLWLMGVGVGLGLMTKTTMILIVAVIVLMSGWIYRRHKFSGTFLMGVGVAVLLGGMLFLSLRLSPSFGALFSRSGDFTFSISEILAGQRDHIVGNWRAIGRWLEAYLTLSGLGLLLLGIWWWVRQKHKGMNILNPLSLFIFGTLGLVPYVIMGQVITARYVLPVVVFYIPAMALILARWWDQSRWLAVIFGTGILVAAIRFNGALMVDPGLAPLPHEEQIQYLAEWSSGHGIPEVRDFIRTEAQGKRVVVATEGYFGTLPDGLLMYFDASPLIKNLEIYGIGQPITSLSEDLLEKARHDDTYLVVNSHRFFIDLPHESLSLVAEYPRPLGGPSLLLLQVFNDE